MPKRGLKGRRGGITAVALATTVVVGIPAARAALTPSAPASRYASIVMEAESGTVLYERNADLPRVPASLTKIMTLYMTFEALTSKKLALTDELTVSAHAAGRDPSRLDLTPGAKLKVEDAIRAMTTKSANDAACAIGEALGKGSETRFADAMTAKAKALGLTHTVFRNASGLPEDGHITSARDLAILCRALLHDYPEYYRYFSTSAFDFKGTRYPNQNRFLQTYYGADGIKTGFVNASGHNLAASAVRGGKRLIAIVLGGDTQAWTREHATRLLDVSYAKIDPSLVMVASNATASAPPAAEADGTGTGSTSSPAAVTSSPAAVVTASSPAAVTTAPPAVVNTYATPGGAVTIVSTPPPPLPQPNTTANPAGFAATASTPKPQAGGAGTPTSTAQPAPNAPAAAATRSPATPVPAATASKATAAPVPAPAVTAGKAAAVLAAAGPASRKAVPPTGGNAVAAAKPASASPAPAGPSASAHRQDQVTQEAVTSTLLAQAGRSGSGEHPIEAPAARSPSSVAALPASAPPVVGAEATASTNAAPAPVTASSQGGGWSVQVGLYRDATVARQRGEEARSHMPLQLRGADLVVDRALDGVHVASRIGRLSEEDARAACTELQRGRFPCVVVPPGRPLVVATN